MDPKVSERAAVVILGGAVLLGNVHNGAAIVATVLAGALAANGFIASLRAQSPIKRAVAAIAEEVLSAAEVGDATEPRRYSDFVPLGATIAPIEGTEDVMWTCKFRNGMIKKFRFALRSDVEELKKEQDKQERAEALRDIKQGISVLARDYEIEKYQPAGNPE
ncbi:MAG: hypothetical protein SWQ30_10385 [Thermodesulfobacteriota bacterium]|nr:hypothetical protein [Thermodesulfobacteriota bacterium]